MGFVLPLLFCFAAQERVISPAPRRSEGQGVPLEDGGLVPSLCCSCLVSCLWFWVTGRVHCAKSRFVRRGRLSELPPGLSRAHFSPVSVSLSLCLSVSLSHCLSFSSNSLSLCGCVCACVYVCVYVCTRVPAQPEYARCEVSGSAPLMILLFWYEKGRNAVRFCPGLFCGDRPTLCRVRQGRQKKCFFLGFPSILCLEPMRFASVLL